MQLCELRPIFSSSVGINNKYLLLSERFVVTLRFASFEVNRNVTEERILYTLGQAAKEVGCSKATISRAIKNGKLSAKRLEDNTYQIQPSELNRWVDSNGHRNSKMKRITTPEETPKTPIENNGSKAEVDGLRSQIDLLVSERDDLRKRLDNESEERRKLTAMIADQRPKGLWSRLTGK